MAGSFIPTPGSRVGRWTLSAPLGRGAFGTTWMARDDSGELGAVKILPDAPGDELRALARVCHPAVVGVLDAGMRPAPYIVMDLAPGHPLTMLLRGGPPPEELAVQLTAILADALAAVHGADLLHGDLKPDNVIVDRIQDHRVSLVDFGMAGGGHGGTLDYAAPERIGGSPATPQADIYALGLLLWQMLHGSRPWAEVPLATALNLRRTRRPTPTAGSPWVQELLGRLLSPDPLERPGAAELADTLAAHGATLPKVDAGLIRRRARRVLVSRRTVGDELRSWLDDGSTLGVVGADGSGRSRVLAQLGVELHARGIPWILVAPGGPSWAPVQRALADPALPGAVRPLPVATNDDERARLAAVELVERGGTGVCILVDDVDDLDPGTLATLGELARLGRARLCLAGATLPAWIPQTVTLEPLDLAQVQELVVRLLGDVVEPGRLARRLHEVSGGMPGRLHRLIIAAVDEGVLTRSAHRWIADELGLSQLLDRGPAPRVDGLSQDARQLGALVAAHGRRVRRRELLELARDTVLPDLTEEGLAVGLAELADAGLIYLEADGVRCPRPAVASALLSLDGDGGRLHARLLERVLAEAHVPWLQAGWHILGAGREDLAATWGAAAIQGVESADPVEALRLAEALWERWPLPALAAPRVDAMVAAGSVDEARQFCEQLLEQGRDEDLVDVLVAWAFIELHHAGDDAATMELLSRAWDAIGDEEAPTKLLINTAQAHFRADRLDQAISVARILADRPPPEDPEDLDHWLGLRGTWAQAVHRQGDVGLAVAILEGVSPETGAGRASRAILDANRGRLLWHAGRMREAAAAMTEASAAEAGLPALERARLLNNAGLASYEVGDLNTALDRWESALLLAERMDAVMEQVRLQNNLCVGYREARRWERSRQAGEWVLRKAVSLSLAEFEAMAAGNLGDLAAARGRDDEAREWFDRCGRLAREHGLTNELVELARRRAELALRTDPERAADACASALAAARNARTPLAEAQALALSAVSAARTGRAADAEEYLQLSEGILRSAGATRELAWARRWAGETWAALGQNDKARDALSSAVAFAGECGHALLRAEARDRLSALSTTNLPSSEDRRILQLLGLVSSVLGRTRPDDILEEFAQATLDILDGDRAIVLIGQDADQLAAQATRPDAPVGGTPSRTVVERCLASRRPVIAVDIDDRADLKTAHSVVSLGLRSVMCVPLLHDDDVLGAIYVDSQTSTERRMESAEELVTALAATGAAALAAGRRVESATARAQSAAELAHDLRNPLASIVAIATMQATPGATPASADTWNDLSSLCRRLDGMIGSWLDRESRPRAHVDLVQLTRALLRTRGPVARAAGVELEFEPAVERAELLGDGDEVERALQNLLGNAIKYAPPGSRVTVDVAAADGGVTWTVRDCGRGLPVEAQAALLQTGVQGPEAVAGHGLGLAIAHRILREHGGHLVAGNHPEGGAVFRAWLPASRPAVVSA